MRLHLSLLSALAALGLVASPLAADAQAACSNCTVAWGSSYPSTLQGIIATSEPSRVMIACDGVIGGPRVIKDDISGRTLLTIPAGMTLKATCDKPAITLGEPGRPLIMTEH